MRDVTGNVSVCDINGVILIGWPSVTRAVIIALDNWFRSSQITGLGDTLLHPRFGIEGTPILY